MSSSFQQIKRASVACLALGSIALSGTALAGGTAPGTAIDNTASVNYSVGGVAQTVIRSSPTGNSTPGTPGTATSFVVDRKVDLYLAEVNGAATSVIPGSPDQVTTFFIRNDGNDTQGVSLSAADFASAVFGENPDFQMTPASIRVFVESTAAASGATCNNPAQPGGMSFTLGTDSATSIPTLAPDTCTWVYIVANTPSTAGNAERANVELTAIAREPTTLTALSADTGADRPDEIDVVFVDEDATVVAQDQYLVATASFTVRKQSSVIDDFVSTSNYKAIPGALMQYEIELTNNGSAQADSVAITDSLPTQTAYEVNSFNGTSDVNIQVGATNTFCVAEAGGADANGDGCWRSLAAGVSTLHVQAPALAPVPASGAVTVRFRVKIL
ncbi:MAG TPA: hypothetical protein VFP37_08540 [Steroidobacteraceae bacterium]|nr:hypothetical protein [Steroidobacteraceae bacterium]